MGVLGGCLGPVLTPALGVGIAATDSIGSSIEGSRQLAYVAPHPAIYESTPTVLPRIGTLRLAVYPLNATAQLGQKPFVICVVPESPDGSAVTSQMATAALDPARIQLTLPDKTAIKPSGYALAARCPYPELSESSPSRLDFRELDTTRPLIWRRDTTEPVTELAFRFDIATPSPDQKFSFDLGALTLNQRQHNLPRIEFEPTPRGRVLRATPQGHATPNSRQ